MATTIDSLNSMMDDYGSTSFNLEYITKQELKLELKRHKKEMTRRMWRLIRMQSPGNSFKDINIEVM